MRRFLELFFFLVIVSPAFGQIQAGEESITLVTDRDIYFAGDVIWFGAWYFLEGKPAKAEFSKILLIELLDEDHAIAQSKIPIQEGRAWGTLRIPESISSKNYQLRAYTNWQRNLPPETYCTLELTVLNPASPLPNPMNGHAPKRKEQPDGPINIQGLKERYAPREKVAFTISCPEHLVDASVSVVVKGSFVGRSFLPGSIPGIDANSVPPFGLLPDIRDISLSGMLVDSASGRPLVGELVYVSIVDKNRQQLHIYRSGEDGGFVFPLNHLSGQQKVFLSSRPGETGAHKILVNTDFSNQYATFPVYESAPDSSLRQLLEEMYINHQLQKKYTAIIPDSAAIPRPIPSYFGRPAVSVRLSDFIALPTMEEVFTEIVPYVSIRKKNKHFHLWVLDKAETGFDEDPLVLIDNLPVFDLDALMQINPALVEQIDVINDPYILGSQSVASVIQIRTSTSDFAGIKFPESTVFLNYQTRDVPLEFPEVKYDTQESRASRTPDFRTVLYWDPHVTVDGSGKEISFFTSDHESAYSVLVRGIDDKGRFICWEEGFTVDLW